MRGFNLGSVFLQTNIETLQLHLIRLETLKARLESRKQSLLKNDGDTFQSIRLEGILDELDTMVMETKQELTNF